MVARNTIHIDGTLGTSSPERFSIGFTYQTVGGGALTGNADLQAWATWAAGFANSSASNTWLGVLGLTSAVTQVRVYAYGPTGPAIRSAVAPVTGGTGTGTAIHPFQIARCVTLLTGQAGRSRRGRVYLPDLVTTVAGATGKSSPPVGISTGLVGMLNRFRKIDTAGADILEPVVHSRTLNELTVVNAIRVGDVLDTQRRRRDNLAETYATSTL